MYSVLQAEFIRVSGALMSSLFSSLSYSHLQELLPSFEMARFNWKTALVAVSSLVAQGASQSSASNGADGLTTVAGSKTETIATATVNGTPTTFSVAFTVPASADTGPNILPNVKDPSAKQAQQLCPGYTASNVQRSKYGFTASLSMAGDAVGITKSSFCRVRLTKDLSVMSTEQISRT